MKEDSLVFGRNPAIEALKGDRTIEKVILQDGASGSVGKIVSLAKDRRIRVEYKARLELDKLVGGKNHQGVVVITSSYEYKELEDLLGGELLVLLDGIEDPHNLGAIMRTAECVGASGVVIPKRRSVGLTDTVAKTSAGAIEHIPCARVSNMANAIEKLKENGFWICAADMDGQDLWSCDLGGKLAIVIGNEGKGVSRLVKEKCDFTISIPMVGKISSLNASNAAAVIMYEVFRQRAKNI
ncbi:MAG: 23S rRNA (guanosine(2251)-2'-O)-methyltransferase RlmB [Firmicutes bacterium]|nr:23S rRNA (guanosine(2251)-2'-O)-methyltransferase RlmB [Bacillota bacterium]